MLYEVITTESPEKSLSSRTTFGRREIARANSSRRRHPWDSLAAGQNRWANSPVRRRTDSTSPSVSRGPLPSCLGSPHINARRTDSTTVNPGNGQGIWKRNNFV